MSCTYIYKFNNNGYAESFGEAANGLKSGWAVWTYLEKKYLPTLPLPLYKKAGDYHSRLLEAMIGKNPKYLQEIWDLWKGESKLSHEEKVVLLSTFDQAVVYKSDLSDLINCFKAFGGNTNFDEQLPILKKLNDDEDCIAVGWQQTSVSEYLWCQGLKIDPESEERHMYNILKQEDHFDIYISLSDCLTLQ